MAERCPEPDPSCRFYDTDYCILTVHHEFHPGYDYRTALEKRFRSSFCHLMRWCDHIEQHKLPPPVKPSEDQMLDMLEQLRHERTPAV